MGDIIFAANNVGFHVPKFESVYKSMSFIALTLGQINIYQLYLTNRAYSPSMSDDDIIATRHYVESKGIKLYFHGSCVKNLCGGLDDDNGVIYSKSIDGLIKELDYNAACKGQGVVVHFGSTYLNKRGESINKFVDACRQALDAITDNTVHIATVCGISVEELIQSRYLILENSCGEGNKRRGTQKLGSDIEEILDIVDMIDDDRVGVCIDTCHLFAAGYNIADKQVLADTLESLGEGYVKCFHLNDSAKACGSNIDRHDIIPHGFIFKNDISLFTDIINYAKHNDIDCIIETTNLYNEVELLHKFVSTQ